MTIPIEQIRKDYSKAPRFSAGNTHEAMIVKLYSSKNKFSLGVNYWTPEQIGKGERVVDGCRQVVVTLLYF